MSDGGGKRSSIQSMTTWDDAALAALQTIYANLRQQPSADLQQLRNDLDQFIAEMFSEVDGSSAQNKWAIIGRNALEITTQRNEPFDISDVHQVLVGKQRDYGPENISRFGRQGLMVRMHDKVARLENLLSVDGGGKPHNESIKDNLLDVVGYSTVGIMWESQTFLLPLKSRDH